MSGISPSHFRGVHMKRTLSLEDLLLLQIFNYDCDFVDGIIMGALAQRSVQKHENTVRLLRYKNFICYAGNINAVFQSFRFPNCNSSSTTCNCSNF